MEVTINYDYDKEDLADLPLVDLAKFVMAKEKCPENTQVSISFVANKEIQRLNETYRKHQGPTDVLSFECDNVDDGFDGEKPEGMPYELGDIVIAPDVARGQMADYGTTFEEEIETLITHGLLHLCGYDHIDPEDAKVMLPHQEQLLKEWWEK